MTYAIAILYRNKQAAHHGASKWRWKGGQDYMQNALHLKTTVLPGGRIEMADHAFPAGEEVEVIVLLPASPTPPRRSAVDILAEAPGHRLFKTAADVDDYLQQEREAWDR